MTHMEILEVPELLAIPNPAPYDAKPDETTHYLMIRLLRLSPAMLHAEFKGGEGRWFVRVSQASMQDDECIAESRSVGEFRSVLAYFGAHYMNNQLYGGHTRRMLTQLRRKFVCELFMSNQGWPGYWIRVYVTTR